MSGRRTALIVANDTYDHSGLARLRAPAADADALAGVLGDPSIGGFEVEIVRNGASYDIAARVEDVFATARPEDLLLVHFSCHGLKSDSGELFLAARNTRPDRLGSTAVAAGFVQRCLRASRAHSVVLLLDCCYGSAFGQGVAVRAGTDVNLLDSFPAERLGAGRGRAVISAASSTEFAFEGEQLAEDRTPGPSVFTSALVEGLSTGEADRDEDGWVSVNELYDYVYEQVRARSPHQTPGRDIEMQGELYLARSRRRRIRPEPIPADLRAAVTDENVFTRLGAVAELRSRVASSDLGVAAGAYEALREIARTDIQYVAEAAERAVRDAAPAPDRTAITFGAVTMDSEPPQMAVGLTGPPLARSLTARTAERWLSATVEGDRVEVRVDTSQPGPRRGTVTLTGPSGSVDVAVEGDVVAGAAAAPATPATPAEAPPRATLSAEQGLAVEPLAAASLPPLPSTPDRLPASASPAAQPARRLRVWAGWLAVVAAFALAAALRAPVVYDVAFADRYPEKAVYGLLLAAGVASAGAALLGWRGRPLVGTGIVLGLAAAGAVGLALLVAVPVVEGTQVQTGWYLDLAGYLLLVTSAVLATIAARRWPGLAWTPVRRRPSLVRLLVVGSGLVIGGALLAQAQAWTVAGAGPFAAAPRVLALAAVIVAVGVALLRPSALAGTLLIGWVVGTLAYVGLIVWTAQVDGQDVGGTATFVLVVVLVAQVVFAVLLMRQDAVGPSTGITAASPPRAAAAS